MKIDVVRIELVRSYSIELLCNNNYVFGVETAGPIFCKEIGRSNVEQAAVLCMDSTNRIINFSVIAIGEIEYVKVPTAQIIKTALLSNASKIIIGHNHPSGVLKITDYDIGLTKKIGALSMQLGIDLIDSLVVNAEDAISIREQCKEL